MLHVFQNETNSLNFTLQFSKQIVLECYSDFVNNFMAATDLLKKTCREKAAFQQFIMVWCLGCLEVMPQLQVEPIFLPNS